MEAELVHIRAHIVDHQRNGAAGGELKLEAIERNALVGDEAGYARWYVSRTGIDAQRCVRGVPAGVDAVGNRNRKEDVQGCGDGSARRAGTLQDDFADALRQPFGMHHDGRAGHNAGGGYLGVRAEGESNEKDDAETSIHVGLLATIVPEAGIQRRGERGQRHKPWPPPAKITRQFFPTPPAPAGRPGR